MVFFIAFSLLPTGKPLILRAALLIKRRIEVFLLRSISKPLQTSEKTSLYSILNMDAITEARLLANLRAHRVPGGISAHPLPKQYVALPEIRPFYPPKKNISPILRDGQRLER